MNKNKILVCKILLVGFDTLINDEDLITNNFKFDDEIKS